MEPAIHELGTDHRQPGAPGRQPFGVVGGDLSLQTVVKIINSLDFGGMGYAFLVSGDGKDPRPSGQGPGHEEPQRRLPTQHAEDRQRLQRGRAARQLTRILSFSPVKGLSGLDWYIGISVDKDKAYAMLTKLRTSAIVAALIAVVAIVLLPPSAC